MASYNQDYNAVLSFQRQYKSLLRRLKANEDKPRNKTAILDMLYLVYILFSDLINSELARKYPDAVIQNFDTVDAKKILERLPDNANMTDALVLLDITKGKWGKEKRIDFTFSEAAIK